MEKLFFVLSGVLGALGVAFGAFGAHGLQSRLSALDDFEKRMGWWETAAHYHLLHAVLLAAVAYLAGRAPSAVTHWAGYCIVAGTLLFSGSLYVMTLTGITALGRVTPVGGLCFIAAWCCVAIAAAKHL